jgi:Gpi18-like mannosyltransferase
MENRKKTKKISIKQTQSQNLQHSLNSEFKFSDRIFLLILAGITIFIFIYLYLSPRPYDDDNLGRYFMAQAAIDKPEYFFNMWGRPLAIIFFLLPSQLGYWFCAVATAMLSIGTCFFTYKAAYAAGFKNPWIGLIFVAFQPLFLITSYSLCAEPLAAFTLSLGLYHYYRNQDNASAMALSLMPLARTEMVVLLPIFALAYIKRKKYLPIILSGIGLLIFQIAGMIHTGDLFFLLTAVSGFGHGLYQNGPFSHYFERFIFIIGPVVFTFLLLKLIHDIRNKEISILNTGMILIFFLQVYFYWKGNVASIGFLRHFVSVSPIMALLALEGFNRWAESSQSIQKSKWLNPAVIFVVSVMVLIYYAFDLIGDYFISNEKDYLKFIIILGILLFSVVKEVLEINWLFIKKLMFYFIIVITPIYVIIKEKPLQLAPEQQTVKQFQIYYNKNFKDKVPMTMVAHPWFFFFDDFNYFRYDYRSHHYMEMRSEKLDSLAVGSLIAWDSHYSWRLSQNVQLDQLKNDTANFQYRNEFVSSDRKFAIYLFEKVK